MRHANQVVTRTMLLENVWNYHFDPQTNVIDVHISNLRQKIDAGYETPLLRTVRGAGYMLTADYYTAALDIGPAGADLCAAAGRVVADFVRPVVVRSVRRRVGKECVST